MINDEFFCVESVDEVQKYNQLSSKQFNSTHYEICPDTNKMLQYDSNNRIVCLQKLQEEEDPNAP